MTIAVTGAAGHLGSNLIQALLAEGEHVRAVTFDGFDAHVDGILDHLPVELHRVDPTDLESVTRALTGCEVVHHTTALHPTRTEVRTAWDVNAIGAAHVAEAARLAGARRLVHASSVETLEPCAQGRVSENCDFVDRADADSFAASMATGERAVLRQAELGLDVVIVSPSNMVGPNDHVGSTIGRFLDDLWAGRIPALVPGGLDLVDVRDVARTMLAAVDAGGSGARYLVGGRWASLLDFARHAAAVAGRGAPRIVAPRWAVSAAVPVAQRLSRHAEGAAATLRSAGLLTAHRGIDDARAHRELGHHARPLGETLLDTFRWHEDNDMGRSPAAMGRLVPLLTSLMIRQ